MVKLVETRRRLTRVLGGTTGTLGVRAMEVDLGTYLLLVLGLCPLQYSFLGLESNRFSSYKKKANE